MTDGLRQVWDNRRKICGYFVNFYFYGFFSLSILVQMHLHLKFTKSMRMRTPLVLGRFDERLSVCLYEPLKTSIGHFNLNVDFRTTKTSICHWFIPKILFLLLNVDFWWLFKNFFMCLYFDRKSTMWMSVYTKLRKMKLVIFSTQNPGSDCTSMIGRFL